jgi:glycosyltransferase involved in cell wall biosynthesis
MCKLVSILIPAYNAERFIEQTLKSALSQTWRKKEVIIVDDGSTDKTVNICRRFESSRVKIIRQQNQGGCVARNTAFEASQGDYIQWLDADDLLGVDKIEKQARVAQEIGDPAVLFTCTWGSFFFRPGKAKFKESALWRDLSAEEWLLTWLVDYMMPVSTWLISRQLSEQIGRWDTRLKMNQDGEYFCRAVVFSRYVKFVPEAVFYYRQGNRQSLTKSRSQEKWQSFCLSLELIVQHVLGLMDDERARNACISRLNKAIGTLEYVDIKLTDRLRKKVEQLGGDVVQTKASKKQQIVERLFGREIARGLKAAEWRARWQMRSKLDFFLAKLFGS